MAKKAVQPNKVYTDPNNPNKKYIYKKVEVVPSTPKHKLGRIIMFIVGLGFIGLAISPIVSSISALVKIGFTGNLESYYHVFSIVSGFLSIILFATTCFVAAFKGKAGIKNIIYFIVMLILVISGTVLFFVNKTPINFGNIISLIFTYALPILYILAFSLMTSPK